jgi:MFS family permease
MSLDKRPAYFYNFPHEILYVSVLSCAQLLTQAALGNVLVPLHFIKLDIGITNPAELPWTLAAYSLTVGVFIMITGRLGDIFGHKLLVMIGYIMFSIFSFFTGLAGYFNNGIYFHIMRAFQGIGPTMLLPNAVALLARAYPVGLRKSIVFSIFGATAPAGFILGGLFGSIFAQFVWWPWAHWSLAIFCYILAIFTYIVVPTELSRPVHPTGKTDVLGAIIGVTGLILFIYCWNEGPVAGWDKPYVYGVLIGSIVIIAIFVFVEMRTEEPIMPLSIWSVPGFPGVLGCMALGWASFGIFIYYIVQFLENIRNASPLLTTAMLTPLVIFGVVATITVSQLYGRIPAHYLLMASMIFFCVGNILIATAPADQTYWGQVFVATILTPFGMDISFPAASLVVSNRMPTHQQGVAASMLNTAINWSISLGLGIAGTVESEMIKRKKTTLEGYRHALYAGVGLSALGVFIALVFCRVPKVISPEEQRLIDDSSSTATLNTNINTNTINDDEPNDDYPNV